MTLTEILTALQLISTAVRANNARGEEERGAARYSERLYLMTVDSYTAITRLPHRQHCYYLNSIRYAHVRVPKQ